MQYRRTHLALAAVLSLAAFSSQAAGPHAEHKLDYMPKGFYATTVPGTRYVEASASRPLAVGEKIARLFARAKAGETILQRLTEHSYWVMVGNYNTVFYVGQHGVLLLDPLADGAGATVQKAIASVTPLPVTALVYSHNHADHIGDAQVFVDSAKTSGQPLRIIASSATAEKQSFLHSTLPTPTEVVPFDGGRFTFEDLTVQVQGFTRAAHTDDSAGWLLVQERVIHAPDMANPDQMPYLGFGGSENAVYLPANLAQLAAGDWHYFSGGHGNIGSKADITFMQNYVADLRTATLKAMEKVDAGRYFNVRMNNHQAAAHRWNEAVAQHATKALRPKYGQFYGFEASVPHQVDMMIEAAGSYR